MEQYLSLLQKVKRTGNKRDDRTGVGTLSTFGHQMRFNLQDGFPIITTKYVYFEGLVRELLWMLRGETTTEYLNKHGVDIWDKWADENGDLGPIYGKQWRHWESRNEDDIDQINNIINNIKNNPYSRRHVVNAWNVSDIDKMALPPCHVLFQFYVNDGGLSCQVYIRSNDLFIGAPFNISEYALLTYLVAYQCDLEPHTLVYTIGDAHIYLNHLRQVDEQLSRTPYSKPSLSVDPNISSIDNYTFDDIHLEGYKHHPPISAPVAV